MAAVKSFRKFPYAGKADFKREKGLLGWSNARRARPAFARAQGFPKHKPALPVQGIFSKGFVIRHAERSVRQLLSIPIVGARNTYKLEYRAIHDGRREIIQEISLRG